MTEASDTNFSVEVTKGIIAKFTMAALGFAGTIIFARILGRASFGGFYLLLSLIQIVDRPAVGWSNAAKKRFSEVGSANDEILGTQLLFGGVAVVVFSLFAFLFRKNLVSYTSLDQAPLLFSVLFTALVFFVPLQNLYSGTGKIGVLTWVDTVRSVLTFPLQLVLVLTGLGAAGMVYGLSAATYLTIPITFYLIRVKPAIPSSETFASLWKYAKYSILNGFMGKAYSRYDVLLLGYLISAAAVADYEVAFKLTVPAMFVADLVGSGLMARVSNKQEKGMEVATDITNSLAFASILSIPIFFGAVVLSEQIIVTAYGAKYITAAPLLIGLALYQVIRAQRVVLTDVVNGLDLPNMTMKIGLIILLLNVIVGYVLTLYIGAMGVVIATVVSESLMYLGFSIVVKSQVPQSQIMTYSLLHQLFAGFAMAAVIGVAHVYLSVGSYVDLLMLVMLGAIVYSLILTVLSEQVRTTVNSVFSSVKRTRM